MAEPASTLPRPRARDVRPFLPSTRSLVCAAATAAAVAVIYVVARESGMFAVARIDVQGASPSVAAQARSALRSVDGQSLMRLDGAAVVATLERLPSVYRARYDRDFPHTLRVWIVPERPVAVVRRGLDSWAVSARGRIIARVRRGGLPSLPRIWLGATVDVGVGALLRDPSASLASRVLASFRGARLGRIAYVKATGGRIVVGLRTGVELLFGPPADLALKLAIARAILPMLAPPNAGGPRYLDLAVPERPVAGGDTQVEG
jgi:cell division septal protein FtsQ